MNHYFCNDIFKKPLLQNNKMCKTSNVLEDNRLLQKTKSTFCDNSVEKTPENENKFIDYTKILQNNIQDSSDIKCDEIEKGANWNFKISCIKRRRQCEYIIKYILLYICIVAFDLYTILIKKKIQFDTYMCQWLLIELQQ